MNKLKFLKKKSRIKQISTQGKGRRGLQSDSPIRLTEDDSRDLEAEIYSGIKGMWIFA